MQYTMSNCFDRFSCMSCLATLSTEFSKYKQHPVQQKCLYMPVRFITLFKCNHNQIFYIYWLVVEGLFFFFSLNPKWNNLKAPFFFVLFNLQFDTSSQFKKRVYILVLFLFTDFYIRFFFFRLFWFLKKGKYWI